MSALLRSRTRLCASSSSAKNAWRCCLDRRAGVAEALPELVGLVLRAGGGRSAAGDCHVVEEGVEVGRGLLPLRLRGVAGGERLGLLDELGALGDRLVDGGLRLGRLLSRCSSLVMPGERLEARRRATARSPTAFAAATSLAQRASTAFATSAAGAPPRDALLEQADLAREIGVLALEVGERLFGRAVGVLPDGALAVGLAHEDGAVSSTRPHGCCV